MSEQINYYPPDLDTGRSLNALRMVWRPADDAGLQALATELSTGVVQPLDELEMAALMESMGVTDEVAVRRYGAPDVFALAAAVMDLIHQEGTLRQTPQSVPETGVDIRQTLTDFLRGPLSLVAIGVLVLIMMAYHQFGRWGHAEVLALSLGITGSMFITNGFVQAAARRGSIYWGRGNPLATLQYLQRIMSVAAGCALGTGLLLAALSIWAGFTTGQALIFFLSFCTLSLVWLMAAVLVVLEASAWFGICLLAGLLVGGLVDRLLVLAGSPAHLICGTAVGFVAAMAVMFLVAHRAYRRGRRSRSSSTGVVLPSTAYLLAEATPYFIYGTLYMAFVLSPHVLGWLGRRPAGTDWLLSMEPLELGLSLAMIPLLLASGVAENTSRAFWSQARAEQSTTPGGETRNFARRILRFYGRRLAVYLLVLAAISLVANWGMGAVAGRLTTWGESTSEHTVFMEVFRAGSLAFWLLGLGLFNSIISVSLAQPWLAARSVLWAIGATWYVGLPLIALLRFDLAAQAFVVGAAVFAIASSISIAGLLQEADYYYYASF